MLTQVAQFIGPSLAVCGNSWEVVGLRIVGLYNGWQMVGSEIPLI